MGAGGRYRSRQFFLLEKYILYFYILSPSQYFLISFFFLCPNMRIRIKSRTLRGYAHSSHYFIILFTFYSLDSYVFVNFLFRFFLPSGLPTFSHLFSCHSYTCLRGKPNCYSLIFLFPACSKRNT